MINTNSVQFFKERTGEEIPEKSEIIIAAWKLSNPENIGKIIRLAHNIGAKQALFIKGDETHRESKIKKTAGFSFDQMPWKFIAEDQFQELLEKEYKLTILETCDGANNIFFEQLPSKTILLAGSESHGIPLHIIQKNQCRTYIPMPGNCKSLNISNALSIATFEWYRQQISK